MSGFSEGKNTRHERKPSKTSTPSWCWPITSTCTWWVTFVFETPNERKLVRVGRWLVAALFVADDIKLLIGIFFNQVWANQMTEVQMVKEHRHSWEACWTKRNLLLVRWFCAGMRVSRPISFALVSFYALRVPLLSDWFVVLSHHLTSIFATLIMNRQYQTSTSSRERNRIHARKTRQRKKEQMMTLTQRADGLKSEQIRLMQCINEKTTASILVGLFASDALAGDQQQVEDPRIEALLRRPSDDIPDAAMLPELPALILPGQHNSKKMKSSGSESQITLPDDGIDYDLLGKDRSKCSVAELDKIRRERNRMHAKRTRDRKRFFMEEMAEMCQQLEDENRLLQSHLDSLNGEAPADRAESVISPSMSSVAPTEFSMPSSTSQTTPLSFRRKAPVSPNGTTFDQISTLLEAAGAFSSAISDSSSTSQEESHDSDRDDEPRYKRRRLQEYHPQEAPQNVPSAITTSSATAVGC